LEYYKHDASNKIYLTQFSVVIENQFVFLPYSAGCVWAYAEQMNTVTRDQLGGLYFIKKPVEEIINDFDNPGLVGFSHYIWNENYNDAVARAIKERWPECIIVYGGPQVPDNLPHWYEEHSFVDVCIHQEGEISFNDILSGKHFNHVAGISYQHNNTWRGTGLSKRINNLQEIQSPYLIGLFDNLDVPEGYILNAIMETDRGCPYRCTFCDWGGTTFSKIKTFGLERVYEEIEWAGKNGIELINSANANFGIFKERDNLIADKLIETKAKYGYPKTFETSWAKNSNKDVLELALKLKSGGLLRKFGISMQSLDKTTLENIKRSNLKINEFDSIIKAANENDISVMIELIVGLPGETYETWTKNYCYLMEYENTSIENYPCSLLNNSELNNARTISDFKIEYKVVDFGPIASHYVQETAKQIVGTYSMPPEVMKQTWEWTWCARLGHTVGITNQIVKELRNEFDIKIVDFYENWYRYIKNSSGILNEKYRQWIKILDKNDFQTYIFDYTYIDDLGYLRRKETLEDLRNFLLNYYPDSDADHYVQLFDIYYYTPAYTYPYTAGEYIVDHPGMGSVRKYSAFIGLNRKNRGWKCGIQKQLETQPIAL
jgi:putative methyltransferase